MKIKLVTARKPHWCDGCCRLIEAGEQYERETNLIYGRGFAARKRCLACAQRHEQEKMTR